jgi:hypothetical protein
MAGNASTFSAANNSACGPTAPPRKSEVEDRMAGVSCPVVETCGAEK